MAEHKCMKGGIPLLFIAGIMALLLPHHIGVSAQGPGVSILNIVVESGENREVSGFFVVRNDEDRKLADLAYVFTLFDWQEDNQTRGLRHMLFYEKIKGEKISLEPRETKTISFTFSSTLSTPQGSQLQISLLDNTSFVLASDFVSTNIAPQNSLIIIDASAPATFGEFEAGKYEGLPIAQGASLQYLSMRASAVNPTNETLSVVPRIETYERNFPNHIASRVSGRIYEFAPGEEKEVVFYPQDESVYAPGTYFTHLSLVDAENPDRQLSTILDARYVIRGVSAAIVNGYFDKQIYQKDEEGDLFVEYVGPADLAATKGMMNIEIFDHWNSIVLEEKREVELLPNAQTERFEFVSQRGNENPWARVTIENNENVLAEYMVGERQGTSRIPWLFVLITAVLLGGIVVLVRKGYTFAK